MAHAGMDVSLLSLTSWVFALGVLCKCIATPTDP